MNVFGNIPEMDSSGYSGRRRNTNLCKLRLFRNVKQFFPFVVAGSTDAASFTPDSAADAADEVGRDQFAPNSDLS